MVTWVSRAQCGLAPPNLARLSERNPGGDWRARVLGVTVHWTGGNAGGDPHAYWRTLQAQAMSGANVNGTRYGDIEYNAGFDDAGEILDGRSNVFEGAHATSRNNIANTVTLGLAYLGAGEPTPQALAAMRAYVFVTIFELHLPQPIILVGHQDWAPFGGIPTACPGSLELPVRILAHQLQAQAA